MNTTRNNLLEVFVWTGALLALALNEARTPDMSGEGLGRAIAFLARGEWREAIAMHWAAPLVVAVLVRGTIFDLVGHKTLANRYNEEVALDAADLIRGAFPAALPEGDPS